MNQEKTIKMDYSDIIEVSTRYNRRMELENISTFKTVSIVSCFLGVATLIAYVILTTVSAQNVFDGFILAFGAIIFGFGLVFWVAANKAIKESEKLDIVNNFVFTKDAVLISSYSDGEYVSEAKCYYKKFAKIKETRHYLILCTSRGNFGVDKGLLSGDEVDKIKSWINSSRLQEQKNTK